MSLRDSVPGLADNHIPLEHAQVAASSTITNTTDETAFDKTFSVPPNRLKGGDVLRIKAWGKVTGTNGTDTLLVKLYIGSTELIASTAVDVADDDYWQLEAEVIIRTSGASGTLVASGKAFIGTPKVIATDLENLDWLDSTAVDTTAAQVISAQATWSAANAGNIVRQDGLTVQLLQADRTA